MALSELDHKYRYEGAPRRRKLISDVVAERGFCSARELSELLGVSEMTIRRDIRKLAEQVKLRDVHGGASALPGSGPIDIRLRATEHSKEKRAVGMLAAHLLHDNMVAAFDAGTTVLEVARHLPPELSASSLSHSVPALAALATIPSMEVVALGGVLNRRLGMYLPQLEFLRSYRADIVFLAASCIRDGAAYCGSAYDGDVKRVLVEIADQIVLVCDSSKFTATNSAMIRVLELSKVSQIITDSEINPVLHRELKRSGVKVAVAQAAG